MCAVAVEERRGILSPEERQQRVVRLSNSLLDDLATPQEKEELNSLLKGDPDACEWYLQAAEIHASLKQEFEGLAEVPNAPTIIDFEDPEVRSSGKKSPFNIRPLALGLAALLLLSLAVLKFFNKPVVEPAVALELHGPGGVAVISRLMDSKWSSGQLSLKEGDALQPGLFALEAGVAQIDFFSGASVVVEGPARLELKSLDELVCLEGKLRVSVPETAEGFTVVTDDYRAVDLGTEFALSVASSGVSQVHVLDGEVKLYDTGGEELSLLKTGSGMMVTDQGASFIPVSNGGGEFVGREQLLNRVNGSGETRFADWISSRETLRRDKSLLLHYDFEDQKPWDAHLENKISSGFEGAVIGARWVEGRWPGKRALEFKRISDRVRLHLPGKYEELTILVSLRVEGFDRWLSSIFLTDGYEEGELHWQMSDQGKLIVGINGKGPAFWNLFSPPVIEPKDLGSWMQLALTVNTKTGEIIQYLDGVEIHKGQHIGLPPIRFGNVEIGNWQSGDRSYPIRSLNGVVDEFLFFDRVLSEGEIQKLSL